MKGFQEAEADTYGIDPVALFQGQGLPAYHETCVLARERSWWLQKASQSREKGRCVASRTDT